MSDLVPFKDDLVTAEELNKLGELGFTDEAKKQFKSARFEAHMWSSIGDSPTPPELVEMREGYYDKDTDSNVMLEYFPEEYTLSELNRLFPGWWTEDMKRSPADEVVKLATVIVEGYLMVSYVTPAGVKVRRLWAVSGSEVKFKSGTKTPIDLKNTFKGARTEWIRIAGKWLGIGLDIYHQHIVPGLRSMFEDRIRTWSPYAEHWKKVAAKCVTGKGFRLMLTTMPSELQVGRVMNCLPHIPEAKHSEVLSSLGKLSNANDKAKEQFENYIITLEKIAEDNKVKKEENGNSKV